MQPFTYIPSQTHVVFGAGSVTKLKDEVERLSLRRVAVLTTAGRGESARAVSDIIGSRSIGVLPMAVLHTPVSVTETAMTIVRDQGVDGLVAFGGGSATGLSKAIALRTGFPQIIVPTTYAGSEVTPVLGETEDGMKVTISDPRIVPRAVLYDVNYTLSLPVGTSLASGMNAMAHAVEALYAPNRNPVTSLMAMEAIRVLARALDTIARSPADHTARSEALYGAWLGGVCLGGVRMGLHHKICHVLGGRFNLSHAETHMTMLPHVLAYNAVAIPELMTQLSALLGTEDVPDFLYNLACISGIEPSLKAHGMPQSGINDVAVLVQQNAYANPRAFEREELNAMLTAAYLGRPPLSRGL